MSRKQVRLSPRVMAPFPIMMNSGLTTNSRWRLYIKYLKKDLIELTRTSSVMTNHFDR